MCSDYVYQPHRDANHNQIVATYEALFCQVIDTHKLGFGFPDILVAFSGYCAPVEIKTEDGELKASQRTFVRDWKGPKIRIVRTAQDVVDHVAEIRKRQAGVK